MTSKVKGHRLWSHDRRRDRNATIIIIIIVKVAKSRGLSVTLCHVLADKSITKSPRNAKIGRKVAHSTGNNAHQVRGQDHPAD